MVFKVQRIGLGSGGWGLQVGVCSLGFGVLALGFGVWALPGVWVWSLGLDTRGVAEGPGIKGLMVMTGDFQVEV